MEILHKAKRIDNGKWILGGSIIQGLIKGEKVVYITQFGKKSICSQDMETGHILSLEECMFYKVDPYTLCVYTGKNDDKGNKIWLHDIIEISTYNYTEPAEYYFGEIIYCEAWACWCIKEPNNEKPIPLHECEGSYKTEITRLGNIFDDADLLGV